MDRSEKFWDRISKSYAKQAISETDTCQFRIEKIKSILRPGDTVLDYGCGTASMSIAISSMVGEIYAIDIPSKMLEIATQRIEVKRIINIKISKSSLCDIDFIPASYAVVLAINIFHFCDDAGSDLNRMSHLAKARWSAYKRDFMHG